MTTSSLRNLLLAFATVVTVPETNHAQDFNLTGLWKDNTNGATYRVRQIGNRVYWIVDGTPIGSFANSLYGEISGNTINAVWVDFPGSPTLSGGNITLRIDSNDRLVKVSSTALYAAESWTRQGTTGVINPGGGGPATAVTWGDRPVPTHRGKNGQRFSYTCPGQGSASGSVWGTDIYTDDSAICTAAVHAGLISFSNGGTVTIEIRPGQSSYTGSNRNTVQTSNYGGYDGSYVFVGGGAPPQGPGVQHLGDISWGAAPAQTNRGKNGQRFSYRCPSGGSAGSAWGTDIYTDDSSLCTAAVHAGVIGFGGGGVTIEIRPGQTSYAASERNGVRTSSYGNWTGSMIFVR